MSSINEISGLGNDTYYEKYYRDRPPEHYIWLVGEIIRNGRPGNILDLGCGPGLFVEMASKWGLDATGIDGSKASLLIANDRNPQLKIIHCLLSGRLPFEGHTIDNVLLNQVIEHLPLEVLQNVLRESMRVLRKNGVLFIYSPNKGNKLEVQKDPTHINALYPSELRSLLLSSGFDILAEPNSCRFGTKNPLLFRCYRALMKTNIRDWLSASTNAYARKTAD